MEPLWSPGVATGGNRRQTDRTLKPQKQAKSVATSCHRLRAMVRRGSPVRVRKRALRKSRSRGVLVQNGLLLVERAVVWSPLMEPLNGASRKERPAFAGLSFLVSRRAVYGPGGGGKQNV